jgi:hypothetical protein
MCIAMMIVLSAALSAQPSAAQQTDVSRVSVAAPVTIVEIDLGKLKGSLRRLSWAPDGSQFYLQTAEADARLGWKIRHYVVGTDGKGPAGVKDEPAWAASYWTWKSAQSAPGVASLTIAVDQQAKRVSATATPMAGNMARGDITTGTGISAEEVSNVTQQSQNVQTFTLKLKGEVIGEFVNAPAIPGLTFGWGKTGSGLVAFARPDGNLMLMDGAGNKQEVPPARNVVLPAFTTDGARLAWLEKTGRTRYTLRIADVKVEMP